MAATKKRKAVRRKSQNRVSMILVTAVVLLLLIMVGVKRIEINQKMKANQAQIAQLEKQIEEQKAKRHEIMQYEVDTHKKEFYEKMAHDKLGLVYPNEIILKEN
ncbi:MAG: septum formation initiator family protein [Lachnospiraceae bacterium]